MTEEEKKLKFGQNAQHDFIEESNESISFWEKITSKFKKEDDIEFSALPERTNINPPDIKPVQPSENKTAIPLDSPFASSFNTITQDTIITGDFNTESELKFGGTLKGDLKGSKNVTISGSVQGNVTGVNVHVTGGAVKGDISASENAALDGNSVVIGDIKCSDCSIDGRVKGSIVADGTVSLQNNAVIHGNITAKNFDAQNGAVISGHVSIVCSDKRKESEIFALPETNQDENKESAKKNNKGNSSDSSKSESPKAIHPEKKSKNK